MRAASSGHAQALSKLIELCANVDIARTDFNENIFGETPLMNAAYSGDLLILDVLIKAGANLELQNKEVKLEKYVPFPHAKCHMKKNVQFREEQPFKLPLDRRRKVVMQHFAS